MVELKPDQLRPLLRKTPYREIKTLICKCLLNAVKGYVPTQNPSIEQFETSHKYLITSKTSVVKNVRLF